MMKVSYTKTEQKQHSTTTPQRLPIILKDKILSPQYGLQAILQIYDGPLVTHLSSSPPSHHMSLTLKLFLDLSSTTLSPSPTTLQLQGLSAIPSLCTHPIRSPSQPLYLFFPVSKALPHMARSLHFIICFSDHLLQNTASITDYSFTLLYFSSLHLLPPNIKLLIWFCSPVIYEVHEVKNWVCFVFLTVYPASKTLPRTCKF